MTITLKKITTQEEMGTHKAVRQTVFQLELGYKASDESDFNSKLNTDHHCYLFMVGDAVAGTCRWCENDRGYKIERFCLLPEFRGKGYAGVAMRAILSEIPKDQKIYLSSPESMINYFERFGFTAKGDSFWDFGVISRYMKLKLQIEIRSI
ncbi:MAG: GNAT family N-acetyltransferase [Flavobacteriaceae bacterium]|nr:GNAT family N-acetyltransferase [Flavobacteriaceae bacterium]